MRLRVENKRMDHGADHEIDGVEVAVSDAGGGVVLRRLALDGVQHVLVVDSRALRRAEAFLSLRALGGLAEDKAEERHVEELERKREGEGRGREE